MGEGTKVWVTSRRIAAASSEYTVLSAQAAVKRGAVAAEYFVLGTDGGMTVIANDRELEATQDRIRRFHAQLAHLRKIETNQVNFRRSASGFLAEVDRMQLEVRKYLSAPPAAL